jgi:acetyl esterase/lipase
MTEESFDVNSFTMLDDITTCIQTVNDTLEKFEIKTDSLALCGYSAGGNLAMLYSYSKFNESAIPIKFVVDMVGPTDYHKSTWGFEEGITSEIGDEDYLNYAISHLSGKSLNDISAEEKEEIVNSISPVYFVNSSSVPSILAYGDSDTIVGIKQQDPLINKLNETGAKYDYILFDNCGHILTDNNTKYEELHQLILKYAEEYF